MSEDEPKDTLSAGLDPLVGQIVQDRYRIERKLGQGGMGAVYLAEHLLIKKKVAIKCLHAGLAGNSEVVRRFHNEAVAATAIGHPNIVDVTDMGRFEDGTFFMALEYLPGRDWQEDLDETGAQPLDKVAHIGIQICDALEAASAKGIVHRDLKPENIFLIERHGDPDFVKVLDFGISKFHDGIGGNTRTGELMGTPYYMAPEQVRGDRNVTHLADVYALGVILFQALSGRVPFEAQTLPELILKIAVQEAPRLDEFVGELPEPVITLVTKMLSKTAHERPQTFAQVAVALCPYLHESSRLFGMSRSYHPSNFSETSIGGSAEESSLGHPVPERARQATPFAARGPDTRGVGTPGEFGRPETSLPGSTASAPALTTSSSPPAPAAPTSSGFRLTLIVASVLVVLGGGFLILNGASNSSPPTQTPPATENTVRVQISTLPPDAELFLDGAPITNPFDGELERDEARHTLLVKREGFQDAAKTLVLSAAQRVFIPLIAADDVRKPSPQEQPDEGPKPVVVRSNTTQPKPRPIPPVSAPAPVPLPTATSAPPKPSAPLTTPPPVPPDQERDLKKIF